MREASFQPLSLRKRCSTRAKFLRKGFDGALDDAGHFGIAASEQCVELLFCDFARWLVTERVLVDLAQGFTPIIDEFSECAFAGAIADETFVVF